MAYEIEIKENGVEVEIKGDTPEGVIKIAESFGLTVKTESKSAPIDVDELRVGDKIKSIIPNAGGFPRTWPNSGTEGVVSSIDGGFVFVRQVESGKKRMFTEREIASEFVKVI